MDNPQAFPSSYARSLTGMETVYVTGMTLRDYFAGHVIAGLTVGCSGMLRDNFSAYAKGGCNDALANRAYTLADAMLKQRGITNES